MSNASQEGDGADVVFEIAESEAAVAEGRRELIEEQGGVGGGISYEDGGGVHF